MLLFNEYHQLISDMNYSTLVFVGFVLGILFAQQSSALTCYNCYIDGWSPLFTETKGAIWEKCDGTDADFKTDCDGICIEMKLTSATDASIYSILRSCAYSEEVCQNLEIDPGVIVSDCVGCDTDKCNKKLS